MLGLVTVFKFSTNMANYSKGENAHHVFWVLLDVLRWVFFIT